ncbi:FecR family protein [Sphingobacterium deserti]|uniref:Anti-FecI sigma factor, FecR n=1 Tax=Sphingobacterium deserti TaxID=1229276 RepID=A0A0B8T4D4_9SPHI|nr:FecR family protein [Sphingobacterium deserti]KGE14483.1 anti-FecI sigma factor, FecR [Sphingobacterium deserti]
MDKKQRLKKVFGIDQAEKLTPAEKDMLLRSILTDVHNHRRIKRLRWYTAAAAALLIVSFTFYYSNRDHRELDVDLVKIAKTNEAKFADHEQIQIAATDLQTQNFAVESLDIDEHTSHKLYYALPTSDLPSDERVSYATLYIPFGKRQEFQLPDGSTVWLNAGSYLTFDKSMDGTSREVYLNGEGYFDVKHTGTPFIVKTKHANIQVLGTTFNLSAYEDDEHTAVDLLTGKVRFESAKKLFSAITLTPGERVDYNSVRAHINIDKKSAGTDILWTKKQLAFDNVPLAVLMRKLERVYNVEIIAEESLYTSSPSYSGRLNIDVDIISLLKNIYELNDYNFTRHEKEVKITRK